jgi:hypothetical protein
LPSHPFLLLLLLQAPAEPPVPADVLEQQQDLVTAAAQPQQTPQQQQQPGQQQQQVLLPDDDPRWQAVVRSHAAYLSYMQQLAGMVVSKHQQGHQLVYQVSWQQQQQPALWHCVHR